MYNRDRMSGFLWEIIGFDFLGFNLNWNLIIKILIVKILFCFIYVYTSIPHRNGIIAIDMGVYISTCTKICCYCRSSDLPYGGTVHIF